MRRYLSLLILLSLGCGGGSHDRAAEPAPPQPQPRPQPVPVDPSLTFRADRAVVLAGGRARLSWESRGLEGCRLGAGAVAAAGAVDVTPAKDSTYVLACRRPDGTEMSQRLQLTVASLGDVAVAAPTVRSFEQTSVTWASVHFDTCKLRGEHLGEHDVATSGTASLGPDSYRLTCRHEASGLEATRAFVVEDADRVSATGIKAFAVQTEGVNAGSEAAEIAFSWDVVHPDRCQVTTDRGDVLLAEIKEPKGQALAHVDTRELTHDLTVSLACAGHDDAVTSRRLPVARLEGLTLDGRAAAAGPLELADQGSRYELRVLGDHLRSCTIRSAGGSEIGRLEGDFGKQLGYDDFGTHTVECRVYGDETRAVTYEVRPGPFTISFHGETLALRRRDQPNAVEFSLKTSWWISGSRCLVRSPLYPGFVYTYAPVVSSPSFAFPAADIGFPDAIPVTVTCNDQFNIDRTVEGTIPVSYRSKLTTVSSLVDPGKAFELHLAGDFPYPEACRFYRRVAGKEVPLTALAIAGGIQDDEIFGVACQARGTDGTSRDLVDERPVYVATEGHRFCDDPTATFHGNVVIRSNLELYRKLLESCKIIDGALKIHVTEPTTALAFPALTSAFTLDLYGSKLASVSFPALTSCYRLDVDHSEIGSLDATGLGPCQVSISDSQLTHVRVASDATVEVAGNRGTFALEVARAKSLAATDNPGLRTVDYGAEVGTLEIRKSTALQRVSAPSLTSGSVYLTDDTFSTPVDLTFPKLTSVESLFADGTDGLDGLSLPLLATARHVGIRFNALRRLSLGTESPSGWRLVSGDSMLAIVGNPSLTTLTGLDRMSGCDEARDSWPSPSDQLQVENNAGLCLPRDVRDRFRPQGCGSSSVNVRTCQP